MAINLITQPGATVPYSGSDYIQQNLLINAALAQGDEVLTDWAESTAAPAIKQGVYFYHSGNSYQVQDSDSSISGTPVSGANYIGLAESGGVLTASYVTDISGYTWNPAYNGLYDGTTLIIRAVTYLIGSAYHRGLGADKSQSGVIVLAGGIVVSTTGIMDFDSTSITTTGIMEAATLNTGQGDNNLYDMNQNVLTNSSPTFNSVYINDTLRVDHGTLTLESTSTKTQADLYTTIAANFSSSGYYTASGAYQLAGSTHVVCINQMHFDPYSSFGARASFAGIDVVNGDIISGLLYAGSGTSYSDSMSIRITNVMNAYG